MRKKHFNLQLFDDGGQGGAAGGSQGGGNAGGGNGASGNAGATYSYEQAEEIANSRADRAAKSAVTNYFRQQGMTQEQAEQAFADFKAKQKASAPDIAAIEKERDQARQELAQMKNSEYLRKKGVRDDDLDYVMFKVSQQTADGKTTFEKAADAFLKENPRYGSQGGSYRVSTGTQAGGSGSIGNSNDTINNSIRQAFRR